MSDPKTQASSLLAPATGSGPATPSIRVVGELVAAALLAERIVIRQTYAYAALLGSIKWAADALQSGDVTPQTVVAELRAMHRAHCAGMDAEYGMNPNNKVSHDAKPDPKSDQALEGGQ